jgi:hypothetical protein
MSSTLQLSELHYRMLSVESSIADEVIKGRGYRTIRDVRDLAELGFSRQQCRPPGLLLPLHTTDGSSPFSVYRPDTPRIKDGRPIKYELPAKCGVRLDCPPVCRPLLADPSVTLRITEGQKKGDALASRGACVIALLGVWNFKGKNPFGGTTFLSDWDYVALDGRAIHFLFDSDLLTKSGVRQALDRLTEHLQRKKAHVSVAYLPTENGKKIGVDEYLAAGHTLADLEALIEGPRPQPQPAPTQVELLEEAPLTLRRPLALIENRTYVVIWPHVRVTVTETVGKDGQVVRLNPPQVTTEQRQLIVRDDGRIFGDGGDEPLSALGFDVACENIPPEDRLWRTQAVKAYKVGARPDPKVVFARLTAAYDFYLDFSRSLGDQQGMCALSSCLSLMTWFAEGFDVLPYPWPNGEWGSGKSKWGTIWALTSHLGQVVTWGGTFAALRDLADQGAALLFDDAEQVDDPKADPDKRALLLAGNRRGAKIPLKEPSGDRTWKIRWVNAYCPRGFTARKRPFGALDTRCLIIPLIRTADSVRGNRDPIRVAAWPCDWHQLQDDLWATALALLPEAKRVWSELDNETVLVGRNFEPWRAPLAIARLFERHGVSGLEKTIRSVMDASTNEKADAPRDYATKVVEALGVLIFGPSDSWTVPDGSDGNTEVSFTAGQIVQQIKELAHEEEVEWASPEKVGRVLESLRVPKVRDKSTKKRERLRTLHKADVLSMLRSYGLLSHQPSEPSGTVRPSEHVNGATNGWTNTDFDWNTGTRRGSSACQHCGNPRCWLTPGGWACRLSNADKERWAREQ